MGLKRTISQDFGISATAKHGFWINHEMNRLFVCGVFCMLSTSASAETLENTALVDPAFLIQVQTQASALLKTAHQIKPSPVTPQTVPATPSARAAQSFTETALSAPEFRKLADALARQISSEPRGLEQLFSSDFLRAVPPDNLILQFQGLYASFGKVETVNPLPGPAETNTADFLFAFEKDFRMSVSISISTSMPPLISSVQFRAAYPAISAVIEQLRRLPGKVNFELASLDPAPRPIYSLNADTPLPIGSAFKLYVLSSMMRYSVNVHDGSNTVYRR